MPLLCIMYISVATTCELHMEGLQLRMRAVYSWELRVVQFMSLQSIETVEVTTALVKCSSAAYPQSVVKDSTRLFSS